MAEESQVAQPPAETPQSAVEQFNAIYDVAADEPNPNQSSSVDVEPAPEPSTPAPGHRHPSYLRRMASEEGFSDEEIKSYPSDVLGDMIGRIRDKARRNAEEWSSRQPQQTVQHAPPPPPEQEPEIDLGIDTNLFDPEIVKALKKVASAPLKEVRQLKAELAEERKANKAREGQAVSQRIDAFFNKLPAEFTPIFGKGTGDVLRSRDPAAYRAREEAFQDLKTLTRRQDLTIEEKLDRIVKLNHPDIKPAKPAAPLDEPNDELEQRKKDFVEGVVARPASRKVPAAANGSRKAEKSVAEILNQSRLPENNNVATGHATKDDFLE